MSSLPLQDYLTNLLKEQNVIVSLLEVQIVNDNSRVSKKCYQRFTETHQQRSCPSTTSKNFKMSRWSSSPLERVRSTGWVEGLANNSNSTTTVAQRLLKSDKWSATNVTRKSNPKSRAAGHPTPLPSSLKLPRRPAPAALMVHHHDKDVPTEQPSLRRCTSLDTPMMLPVRMSSFTSKSKSYKTLLTLLALTGVQRLVVVVVQMSDLNRAST
ncbi:unnamed protein product [Cylindrotheca closterium]|uniref:Uncharacterized protein n=1 Tax=Cylindrotheca closterium TaxID=2856 RepID=A0AAD2CRA0_9STRA|nr:unnamed protein product [Cylindrotheca closterium]